MMGMCGGKKAMGFLLEDLGVFRGRPWSSPKKAMGELSFPPEIKKET